MSDQPGIGEIGRGLIDLKADVKDLTRKVEAQINAFAERAVSRERYESDEQRRIVEHTALQKQVDDIDEWKKNAFKRAIAIITVCATVAAAAATVIAVILK